MRWDPFTNTGHSRSAAGEIHYQVYAGTHDNATNMEYHYHIWFQTSVPHLITDNKEVDTAYLTVFRTAPAPSFWNGSTTWVLIEENLHDTVEDSYSKAYMAPSPAKFVAENENNLTANNPQAKLIRWHYCLGHLPFSRLIILALLIIIMRRLIHAKTPKYYGSLYRSMTNGHG